MGKMKLKKLIAVLLTACMLLGAIPGIQGLEMSAYAVGAAQAPAVGNGTSGNPYQIATAENLLWLAQNSSYWGSGTYFKQTANIDIGSISDWTPIGDGTTQFSGNYEGCGYSINGLKINSVGNNKGLFGVTAAGSKIENLGLVNVSIAANGENIGSMVGNGSGEIMCCYTTGTVVNSGSASDNRMNTGGLIGTNSGSISDSYSTCNVTGASPRTAGIAGQFLGTIRNCYAIGNISGPSHVGGIVGSAGSLSSYTVKNCFFAGTVTGASPTAGIVGHGGGTTIDYVHTTSGTVSGVGTATNYYCNEASSYYKSQANFSNSTWDSSYPWDFTNVWAIDSSGTINNGFPYLRNSQLAVAPSGTGASGDPYLIANAGNLLWIWENNSSTTGFAGKYFRQTANIDISSNPNWTPIGDSTNKFGGYYDGGGYTISGLTIKTGHDRTGLFSYTSAGSVIINLGLANVDITVNTMFTGALVGQHEGLMARCYTSGAVKGGNYTGGIAGTDNGTTRDCYSTCSVSGYAGTGGVTGELAGEITRCYSIGDVSGTSAVGGVAGDTGTLPAYTMTNCFFVGGLTGTSNVGGIVGYVNGSAAVSYVHTNSGSVTGTGSATNFYCSEVPSYFKTQANFSSETWNNSAPYPWDFSGTWAIDPSGTINNGFPYLLNSQLAIVSYKVTFNTNGGSSVTEQSIISGSKATEPSLPTKAGCIFGGWYTDSALTQAFNFNTPITSAVTLYARWDAIFADFFNDGTLKWSPKSGTWGITSGEYVQSPKGGIEAFTLLKDDTSLSWTDYTFESNVKIVSGGSNDAGVVFRATDENNLYLLAIRTGGIELHKREKGTWYSLATAAPAISNDTWYHYKIVLKADNIKVYFNNSTTALIDKNDSTFASGKIGLRTNNTVANFDNVVVYNSARTVTFDSNGGSAVTSQSVESGNTASAPASPAKTGYTFVGWFIDNTTFKNAFSLSTPITDNITLYAKWTEDSYCVSYDGNGSTVGDVPGAANYYKNETVTVLGNTEATPLSKTGYTFAGWNTATDGKGTPYVSGATFKMGTSPVTLYAQWTMNSYKVTYDKNGADSGTAPTDATPHNYGSSVDVSKNDGATPLKRMGYTFGGWNTSKDGKGTGYSESGTFNMPANDVTLYAVWTVNSYSVSYDGNGKTAGTAPSAADHNYGATVTVLGNTGSLTKIGYTFAGWNTQADGKGTPYAPNTTFSMGTGIVTLYAVWTKDSYTLTYDANGKTALTIPTGGTKSYGSEIEVGAKATAAGYTSIEWNTKADGSGTTYLPNAKFAMPAGDVTLYAIWVTNDYTITYDGNGYTGGTVPSSGKYPYNTDATVSGAGSLVMTGYSFASWNTQADGKGTSYAAGSKFTLGSSDVTLYAQWNINSYNVSYDGNGNDGGAAPSDATAHKYSSSVTVLGIGSLARTGYTFGGWNTSDNGKGTGYSENSTFNMPGNHVILYAVWNINSYSVSYDGNGSTGGTLPEAKSYNYNASVTVDDNTGTAALSRTGYEFAGWSTTPSGAAEYLGSTGKDSFTLGSGNVTLYAVWKLKSFNVTYDANADAKEIDSGTVPTDSVAHDYGSSVTVLGNTGSLVRSGYVFGGWNTSEFGTGTGYSAGSKFNMPGQDVKLYAVWNSGNYTVFYNGNGNTGGTVPSSQTDSYKSSIALQANSGNLSKTGYTFAGWNTKADGKGTTYAAGAKFTIPKNNTILYAMWTAAVSGSYDIPSPEKTNVYIDGNPQNNAASSTTTTGSNGQMTTTVTLNENRMTEILRGLPDNGGTSGTSPVVSIPVTNSDAMVGILTGQMVKDMEKKDVTLEIKTDAASYTLPADQIKIDAVSQQMGQDVKLSDIKVQVEIAKTDSSAAKVVEDSAIKGNFTIVVPPVSFNITCTYSGKTVEVSQFNSYVERTVAIPDGVDPAKITTGVIVDANGNARHVPTKISIINGKYYAQIRSLTNSNYAVVYHPVEFKDVANHWAKDAVNDMGSRLVISGIGDNIFEPDRSITRAEFAAIVVRALGLKPESGNVPFTDVKNADWYSSYVITAAEYKLISGYGDGKFGPDDKITREQAMTMIARAMSITGLNTELSSVDAGKLLATFKDSKQTAAYAKGSIAACIKTGIVSGRDDLLIAPKDNITRAEVAVIVRRLLQKSGLI